MDRSANMIAYTEGKKQETIGKVQSAIDIIKEQGRVVTRKALLEESGVSSAVLSKPYIKEILKQNNVLMYEKKVLSQEIGIDSYKLLLQENDSLKKQIQKLEHQKIDIEIGINNKNQLLEKEQERYNELDIKYQRLLGKWQKLLEHLQRVGHITPEIEELYKL